MKRIVIMGATSGIGLEVAGRLASKGHRVGVAGRNDKALKELKARWPGLVEWETIDVTRDDAPRRLKALIDKLGGMDTYFHIAGVGYDNPTLRPEPEQATIATNVAGFARMVDAAFNYFADNGGKGHIAAITSVAGARGIWSMAAYSASKRFDQTYLEALDQMARRRGLKIKITDIRPGWIRTPLLASDHDYPVTMSLDYAAPRVVSSLHSPCRINYVDWRWALIAGLMKAVPSALWVRLPIPAFRLASPAARKKVKDS